MSGSPHTVEPSLAMGSRAEAARSAVLEIWKLQKERSADAV